MNINQQKVNLLHQGSLLKRMVAHRQLYLMLVPVIIYFVIFKYIPMFGLVIAFQDYRVFGGIWKSPWIGLENFIKFLTGRLAVPIIWNTVIINILSLIFGYPTIIVFALLLNEVVHSKLKRVIQTVTYLPHFISMVVVVSMLVAILSPTYGIVSAIFKQMGREPIFFMGEAQYFRTLYIVSDIWQRTGWGSIIFLAAISAIDPCLYEAAAIDGASRFKQTMHVTLPGISSTIIIMLILRLGRLLEVGFEKIFLMQNSSNRVVSEVLSTYVYQRGIIGNDFGYATAVGLFNSVISLILVLAANILSRKYSESSLW